MRDRYSVVVGLLFVAVIAIACFHTLGSKDEGTLGLEKLPARWPLPEFAVPAAAGRSGRRRERRPGRLRNLAGCPARQAPGALPPAASQPPGAIRVCDLFDRPLVLSFWFTQAAATACDQQDVGQTRPTSATVGG